MVFALQVPPRRGHMHLLRGKPPVYILLYDIGSTEIRASSHACPIDLVRFPSAHAFGFKSHAKMAFECSRLSCTC